MVAQRRFTPFLIHPICEFRARLGGDHHRQGRKTAPVAAGSCAVKSYELGEFTAPLRQGVYWSVWVEKDGEWHAALYHETAATE